jgi:hypothetical protein
VGVRDRQLSDVTLRGRRWRGLHVDRAFVPKFRLVTYRRVCLIPLLADATVDPFPQQVGVTHVAGVLLDHPGQDLAQRYRPAAAAMMIQRVVAVMSRVGAAATNLVAKSRYPCGNRKIRRADRILSSTSALNTSGVIVIRARAAQTRPSSSCHATPG